MVTTSYTLKHILTSKLIQLDGIIPGGHHPRHPQVLQEDRRHPPHHHQDVWRNRPKERSLEYIALKFSVELILYVCLSVFYYYLASICALFLSETQLVCLNKNVFVVHVQYS